VRPQPQLGQQLHQQFSAATLSAAETMRMGSVLPLLRPEQLCHQCRRDNANVGQKLYRHIERRDAERLNLCHGIGSSTLTWRILRHRSARHANRSQELHRYVQRDDADSAKTYADGVGARSHSGRDYTNIVTAPILGTPRAIPIAWAQQLASANSFTTNYQRIGPPRYSGQ